MVSPTLFPRRRNPDESFDSICPTCFSTVANAKTEAEPSEHDKIHVCDPAPLVCRRLSGTYQHL